MRGHGPADFTELVLDACGKLLALSDLGIDEAEGRRRAEQAVADGSAEAVWRRWIEAQGGTADESALPTARGRAVTSPRPGGGYVRALGAIRVGNAAVHLGAGRRTKEDEVDHAVGIVCQREARRPGRAGPDARRRCTRATRTTAGVAAREVLAAYELADEPPPERPVLLEVVR